MKYISEIIDQNVNFADFLAMHWNPVKLDESNVGLVRD